MAKFPYRGSQRYKARLTGQSPRSSRSASRSRSSKTRELLSRVSTKRLASRNSKPEKVLHDESKSVLAHGMNPSGSPLLSVYQSGPHCDGEFFRLPVTALVPLEHRSSPEVTISKVVIHMEISAARELELFTVLMPAKKALGWSDFEFENAPPHRFTLDRYKADGLNLSSVNGPFLVESIPVPKERGLAMAHSFISTDRTAFRAKLAPGTGWPSLGTTIYQDDAQMPRKLKEAKKTSRAATSGLCSIHFYVNPVISGDIGCEAKGTVYTPQHTRKLSVVSKLGTKLKTLPDSGGPAFDEEFEILCGVRARHRMGYDIGCEDDVKVGEIQSICVEVHCNV